MHHGLPTVLSSAGSSVVLRLAVAAPSIALAVPTSSALAQGGDWPPLLAKITAYESPVANPQEPGYDNGSIAIWLNSDNDDQDEFWDLGRLSQPDDPLVDGGDNELSKLIVRREGGPPGGLPFELNLSGDASTYLKIWEDNEKVEPFDHSTLWMSEGQTRTFWVEGRVKSPAGTHKEIVFICWQYFATGEARYQVVDVETVTVRGVENGFDRSAWPVHSSNELDFVPNLTVGGVSQRRVFPDGRLGTEEERRPLVSVTYQLSEPHPLTDLPVCAVVLDIDDPEDATHTLIAEELLDPNDLLSHQTPPSSPGTYPFQSSPAIGVAYYDEEDDNRRLAKASWIDPLETFESQRGTLFAENVDGQTGQTVRRWQDPVEGATLSLHDTGPGSPFYLVVSEAPGDNYRVFVHGDKLNAAPHVRNRDKHDHMRATDSGVSKRDQTTGDPLKQLEVRAWGEQYLSEPVAVWRILNVEVVVMNAPQSEADLDTNRIRGKIQRFWNDLGDGGRLIAELESVETSTPPLEKPLAFIPGKFLSDFSDRGRTKGRFSDGKLALTGVVPLDVQGDEERALNPGSLGPRDVLYTVPTTLPGVVTLPEVVSVSLSRFEFLDDVAGSLRGRCRVQLPALSELPQPGDQLIVAGGQPVAMISVIPWSGAVDTYDVEYQGSLGVEFTLTDDDQLSLFPNPFDNHPAFPNFAIGDFLEPARTAFGQAYVMPEHALSPAGAGIPSLSGSQNPYVGSQRTVEERFTTRVSEAFPGVIPVAQIPGVDQYWYAYVGLCPEIHVYSGFVSVLEQTRKADMDADFESGFAVGVALKRNRNSFWGLWSLPLASSALPEGAYSVWMQLETHREFLRTWSATGANRPINGISFEQYMTDKSVGYAASIAHELGHMLGLGHEDELGVGHSDTLMGSTAIMPRSRWKLIPFERALIRLRQRRPGVPL